LPLTTLLRRLTLVLAMAVWWGGLTFYALVVVPIGAETLGGEIEQGFVTRQVSKVINLLGVATLAVFLWNAVVDWRNTGRRIKRAVAASWTVMAAAQIVLLALHGRLDALLDPQTHDIAHPQRFHDLHEFYISVVGVEWLAALVCLTAALAIWRAADVRDRADETGSMKPGP